MDESKSAEGPVSAEQVARFTGVARLRLALLDKAEYFKPEQSNADRISSRWRVYSFAEIAALRVFFCL